MRPLTTGSICAIVAIVVIAASVRIAHSLPAAPQKATKVPVYWSEADRYVIRGGEVLDRKSGLMWQRCALGRRWSDKNGCVGDIELFTYDQAEQQAGRGWYVPSMQEMIGLYEWRRESVNGTLNAHAFPGKAEGAIRYWTSGTDEYRLYGSTASFDGASNEDSPGSRLARVDELHAVRLVQSAVVAPCPASFDQDFSVDGRYCINGDEVYDLKTRLIWQRCSVGQSWQADAGCVGSVAVFTLAAARQLPKGRWREPTAGEFLSLMDPVRIATRQQPTIDVDVFPDMDSKRLVYWAHQEYTGIPASACFDDGHIADGDGRSSGGDSRVAEPTHAVRWVRDGQ